MICRCDESGHFHLLSKVVEEDRALNSKMQKAGRVHRALQNSSDQQVMQAAASTFRYVATLVVIWRCWRCCPTPAGEALMEQAAPELKSEQMSS